MTVRTCTRVNCVWRVLADCREHVVVFARATCPKEGCGREQKSFPVLADVHN